MKMLLEESLVENIQNTKFESLDLINLEKNHFSGNDKNQTISERAKYEQFINNFYQILGVSIYTNSNKAEKYIDKLELTIPKDKFPSFLPALDISIQEKRISSIDSGSRFDKSEEVYSISMMNDSEKSVDMRDQEDYFLKRKAMQSLFSMFFHPEFRIQKDNLVIVDSTFSIKEHSSDSKNKTDLIFLRRYEGNTYQLTLTLNISINENNIYLGEGGGVKEISQIFSKIFQISMKGDNSWLYAFADLLSECSKDDICRLSLLGWTQEGRELGSKNSVFKKYYSLAI